MSRGRKDAPDDDDAEAAGAGTLRIDKWLWFARFARSRPVACALIAGGKVRINKQRVEKAGAAVRVGDVLTLAVGGRVRVLRVTGLPERRGDAAAARTQFDDLSPPEPPAGTLEPGPVARREPGSGRPEKRDRRLIDRLRGS